MNVKPIIYCYPYTDVGNTYINKNVGLWTSLGYAVKSCPKDFLRDLMLPRAHKTIVLNWYEDWMLGGSRPQILSLLRAVGLLLFFRLACTNIIWVRHNFKPHDHDKPLLANRILVSLLSRLARTVVTHRAVEELKSTVIPHSLVRRCATAIDGPERDIEFLCFGVVRKYKGLDALLQAWPVAHFLVIMGKSADVELTEKLNGIIAARNLRVRWENRFIPDAELNDALDRTKYVILAHEDRSMIVSGAFYHAIACGANILIRSGQFARHGAKLHRFVHTFELPDVARSINNLMYVEPEEVISEANHHYGDDICRKAWALIFN